MATADQKTANPPPFANRKRKLLHLIEDSSDNEQQPTPSTSTMHPSSSNNPPPGQPAATPSLPPLGPSGVNRSTACLGCRKRKSKCSTTRPACEQCTRAKMECIYDDRPQKKPTEVLKDRIKELEDKVKELERTPGLAAALAAQRANQPGGPQSPGLSSTAALGVPGSSGSSPPSSGIRQGIPPSYPTQYSPIEPQYQSRPHQQWFPSSDMRSTATTSTDLYSQTTSIPPSAFYRPPTDPGMLFQVAPDTSGDPLPPELNPSTLIASFVEHRHQAYCDLSVTRLYQSLQIQPPSPSHTSSTTPPHVHPSSSHFQNLQQHPLPVPHPCLLNAIYLLGAFFSPSTQSSSPSQTSPHAYESLLLARARLGISRALETADALDQAVLAASLVAVYLYSKGRVLEGYYLSCANARFAVGCGMHQVRTPVWNGNWGGAGEDEGTVEGSDSGEEGMSTMPLLERPADPVELGERIHIWWQVWMVDQCGAISTNLPPALADMPWDPIARIDTCFPPEISEFEVASPSPRPRGSSASSTRRNSPSTPIRDGVFSLGPGAKLRQLRSRLGTGAGGGSSAGARGVFGTLQSLYDPNSSTSTLGASSRKRSPREEGDGDEEDLGNLGLGRRAMVVKAVELFSKAWKLSKHDVKDEEFRRTFSSTDAAIRRFSVALPRTLNAQGGLAHGLFLPHSFGLAAIIQLHWIVAVEHDHLHPSYQNCLNAAIDMVAIVDVIQPSDYAMLELHIGTCWKLTADVLWREYNRVQSIDASEASLYHDALSKVQEATKQLSGVFPVLGELWRIANT